MKKRILSIFGFITIFAVFFFSSGCPNFKNQYAIDTLPGCEDCPTEIDIDILAELVNKIDNGDYGNIHSLIIIHNDSLALEEYFMDWNRHMLHLCYSATKSVTSALVGIAIDQGKIDGVNGELLSFFSEYDDIENLDERKESITLDDVLSMRPGFTWDESSTFYVDDEGNLNPENDYSKMELSDDWIKYLLDLPMNADPGTQWRYNSGCTTLLSGIITEETGQSAEKFAEENLFSKIGITNWEWTTGPRGITNTAWGLALHPADMAMFGYLFLKKGLLNGEQIMSENWVNTSTTGHVLFYGYHWWVLPDVLIEDHPEAKGTFYALGSGGQYIMIIPNVNMVVVTTAENLPDPREHMFNMLFDYILHAVKEK